MVDKLDVRSRSRLMGRIKSSGNKSTELQLRMLLVREGKRGWKMHSKEIIGKPDFSFYEKRIAIFVDGCFWHGCPKCGHIPKSNIVYWRTKISANVERDSRQRTILRRQGWSVIQIWEHQIKNIGTVSKKINRTFQTL